MVRDFRQKWLEHIPYQGAIVLGVMGERFGLPFHEIGSITTISAPRRLSIGKDSGTIVGSGDSQ